MSAASMKEEEDVVVPLISGYRFLPTDLELVRDYLYKKITNQKLPSDVPVVEYDIYSTEPWNLPVNNIIDTINSKRSYYFVKLLDGIHRRQRIVNPRDHDHNGEGGGGGGYWKKNIADSRFTRYILDEAYRSIGIKKSFAFYAYVSSPAPGRHTNNNDNNINSSADEEEDDGTTTTTSTAMTTWKTNWIMDEYSLKTQRSTQPWALCILRKKKGGEEGDEVELLSKLKQVQQQQQEKLQEPNHVFPERELQLLERIKTTQERIKTNQKQIWEDQIYLGMITKLRVLLRCFKRKEIIRAREERYKQLKDEFSKGKITNEESNELFDQLWEEYWRRDAALKAEIAVISAESSYVVQLPSNFRKRRRGNMNFH